MSEQAFAARHSCDSPEWYTPGAFVEAAREVMGGIDLDPASHAEANVVVGAVRYFTAEDDGLAQPWAGRVFLNPPGGLVAAFWLKLVAAYQTREIEQAIWIGYSLEQLQTLQNVGASMHPLMFQICAPRRRIAFVENEAKRAARVAAIDAENEIRLAKGLKPKGRNARGGSPSHGNYIAYLGADSGRFSKAFGQFGIVR